MRLLNTVYVTEHGSRAGFRSGSVRISRRDGTKAKIPINTIDGIVLTGHAQVSAELMTECVRRQIRLSALSRGGRIRFAVGGPVNGNVHLRVAQHAAAADADHTISLARSFVAGKLQNCRRSIQRWTWDAESDLKPFLVELQAVVEERLSNLASADDGDRIRGIEGDASRRYFRAFALHLGSQRLGMYFTGRRRRPPADPVNALLSFAYGLILTELTGALDAVGLDPQVGFLHRPRPGRPSLALDMLEELRPSVADRLVLQLIGRKRVRAKDFTITGGACYLTEEARKLVLQAYEEYKSEEVAHQLLDRQDPRASLPLVQATLLARHLRGDIAQYPPYVAAN